MLQELFPLVKYLKAGKYFVFTCSWMTENLQPLISREQKQEVTLLMVSSYRKQLIGQEKGLFLLEEDINEAR